MTATELASEIWVKLLGAASLNNAREPLPVMASDEWAIDPEPARDGRVLWLIEGIRGSDVLSHRHVDVFRWLFGRSRRIIQPRTDEGSPDISTDPDVEGGLNDTDARRVWRGLLITAGLEFKPSDDVLMLLYVMDNDPDIMEAWSGEQWPIKTMVDALNRSCSPPLWTDRRVDNAKRRLQNWLCRFMGTNGFDKVDVEGLFARVARRHDRDE